MPEGEWSQERFAEAEEAISAMTHCHVSYFDDFIWCGNESVEAWFFPEGFCIINREGHSFSMDTADAILELAEAPPEALA